MKSCVACISRLTAAFSSLTVPRRRNSSVYRKQEDMHLEKRLDRLACNAIHPIPADAAPRYVRENYALSRGFVPPSLLTTSLAVSSRSFSSFHGSAHQFIRNVHDGDVIVFFYKPACGPCATIRDRIKTARGKLSAPKAGGDTGTADVDGAASPKAVCPPAPIDAGAQWLNEGSGGDGAPAGTMSLEDHAVYTRLRGHLTEKEKTVNGHIRFLAVNTNENDRLTALHDVRSLPTFVAYHRGKIVGRAEGAHEEELLSLVTSLKLAATPHAETDPKAIHEGGRSM